MHHTRKNSHLHFYMKGIMRNAEPSLALKLKRHHMLAELHRMTAAERQQVLSRVDYYCKFHDQIPLPQDATPLSDFKLKGSVGYDQRHINSSYYFDAKEFTRFYPKRLRWAFVSGDVNTVLAQPCIVKSRPIAAGDENRNNILLNLDKVRHFTWVHDPIAWADKKCTVLFRGDVRNKPRRQQFIDMWKDDPLCDLQNTGSMSLYDHLAYKYIMALEGNDVASNLKWVMSSNSVAVMPKPRMETWFMEGQLIANYHYVEIAGDYHDLKERVMYYEAHPDEAQAIVEHAHEWVRQFRNKRRERLISLLVLEKYFTLTGQL